MSRLLSAHRRHALDGLDRFFIRQQNRIIDCLADDGRQTRLNAVDRRRRRAIAAANEVTTDTPVNETLITRRG